MTQPTHHDPAAERALLGAALTTPAAVTDLHITADMFGDARHGWIWSAISRRVAAGDPVSPIFVAADLAKTGQLVKLADGASYLHTCLTACPDPSHAPHYAAIIADHYQTRTLQSLAERLRNAAALSDTDQRRKLANEALEAAHDVLTPPSSNGYGDPGRVRFTALSTIGVRAARWVWDRRLPAGAITLLAGREGIGKSTTTAWLTARITRGELSGEHLGRPRSVAVVATEDAYAEVITPRMIAAGADIGRVYRADITDDMAMISVPADLPGLTHLCQHHDVALVVIDPMMSVIHSSLDTHKDREVRQALDPLAKFAQAADVSVVGLIHVNKSTTTDPLNSMMGSRAFSAAARSVLYCVVDPTAEREDRYLLGHPKSNLGPKQPTLGYHLIEAKVEALDPEGMAVVATTSRVVFDGEDERSIRDVLEESHSGGSRAPSEPAVALLSWLAEQGRTVSLREITAEFSDTEPATLRKMLSRMVQRKQIGQPFRGHYSPLTTTVTRVTSDTSVTTVTSVTRDDHEDVTLVTDVTGDSKRGHLSQTPVAPVTNPVTSKNAQDWVDPWDRPLCGRRCGGTLTLPDELDSGVCRFCRNTTTDG